MLISLLHHVWCDGFSIIIWFVFCRDPRFDSTKGRSPFGFDAENWSYGGIPFEEIAERCCFSGKVKAEKIRRNRKLHFAQKGGA